MSILAKPNSCLCSVSIFPSNVSRHSAHQIQLNKVYILHLCVVFYLLQLGMFLCVVRLGLVSLDLSNNVLSDLGLITRTLVSLASLRNLLLMGNPLAVEFIAYKYVATYVSYIFQCFISKCSSTNAFIIPIHKY